MKLWGCLLLMVVACGSQSAPPSSDPPKPAVARAAPAKPVAIAFVFEGHEMWIGNDKLAIPEDEHYPGVLEPFKTAFGSVPLTDAPAGSLATVITYGETAAVRHPMGPIEALTGAAFGEQKDYAGVIDRDLVGGVTLGIDELAKTKDARRVLVVIGDGTDTNADKAKAALAALAERATKENVQLASFIYKGALSSPANPISALDPSARTVSSVDNIASELGLLFGDLAPQPAVVGGSGTVVALLISGQETWIGNDDIVPADDPARYVGALKGIRAALDKTPLTGFPPGSTAMVLRYDEKLQTQRKLGPIEKLDASALGDQKTYYGSLGNELVLGVRGAVSQLGKVGADRRVLIILGDGSDTNNDAAKAQLLELKKTVAEHHIEVHAIIYKSALSVDQNVVTVLDPKATVAKTSDEITTQLSTLLGSLR